MRCYYPNDNVHRSQNRIESYHQLRSAIAQVGGKKELTGRTDIERVRNMGINLGRSHVAVAKQFLHGPLSHDRLRASALPVNGATCA